MVLKRPKKKAGGVKKKKNIPAPAYKPGDEHDEDFDEDQEVRLEDQEVRLMLKYSLDGASEPEKGKAQSRGACARLRD